MNIVWLIIPPATKLGGGVYWNHHVRPSVCPIGARLMHVGDSSIYLNWLLENMYKVPNSNSGKNYELF